MIDTKAPIEPSQENDYLTLEKALVEIHKLGFQELNMTWLRRQARARDLPFFKLGKRLYIGRKELREHIHRLQSQVVKERRVVRAARSMENPLG